MAKLSSRQRGLSIVSLMVGMLLSILGAVSLMTLYRTIVGQSVQSRQRAAQDGGLAAATLSAQMELQNAGYGIGSSAARAAANTDLVMLSGAALNGSGQLSGTAVTIASGSTASGNAIVWGSRPATAYECSALLVQSSGLLLLRASGSCSAATQWATLSWTQSAELIPAGGIGSAGATLFRVDKTMCWPYGLGSMSALRVSLWDDNSAWKTSACLTNIAGS
ncbi:PilW family protein [Hydrocarboniphaga sp.]|uniref:PilW family protein n=1 Tax=Hydrocarboniphaga sp. TaxID=2033016 RepID=UPI003D0B836E